MSSDPEIEYRELNIPAVELFAPHEDVQAYAEAVREGVILKQFENYNSTQLNELIENFDLAVNTLSYVEGLKILTKYRPARKELCKRLQEKKEGEKDDYTLEDFVKNPTKGISFESIYKEMQGDMDFSYLFSGKRKLLKTNIAAFASFGFISLPHELIHAGTNYLTGGINKHIVINTLYGGSLWEKLIPGVESKLLFPPLGGHVDFTNPSAAGTIASAAAPYLLTPLGIYLMKKGKEKRNMILSAGGTGLALIHLGGVIGDWKLAGQKTLEKGVELMQDEMHLQKAQEYSFTTNVALALGGIYIGSKLMAISYRASKATVNSIRNLAKNKE